jgi:hypothetical protein
MSAPALSCIGLVDGVDVVVDMPNSAVALAVQQIVKDKNKIALYATAATTELTGKQCSPNGIQWVYDACSNAAGLAKALVAKGDKSWYFMTVDYALGISLQAEASKAITALGGTVVGSVRHPLNNPDFSSFLLQAQASNAKVIAFANAGSDTINSVKQAAGIWSYHEPRHRRPACLYLGYPQYGSAGGSGSHFRRRVLLGSQRRYARMVEAVLRKAQGDADDDPCGSLLGCLALPESGLLARELHKALISHGARCTHRARLSKQPLPK